MSDSHRVYITEMSVVSSLGNDLQSFWNSLSNGRSGAQSLPADFSKKEGFPVHSAHQLSEAALDLPALKENLFVTENVILAHHLLSMVCVRMPGHQIDGVMWGHGQLGVKFGNLMCNSTKLDQVFTAANWRKEILRVLKKANVKLPLPQAVINHSNACITGVSTLAEARDRIARGEWRRAIVLVQELRCRDWVLWPYHKLGLLSRRRDAPEAAMRPFALDRDGFVKGEGGVALLLESESAIRESEGQPYCRVSGAKVLADGAKMFEPREDLGVATRCIQDVLKQAGVSIEEIDYINAYGSASVKSDVMETRLIKGIFGQRAANIPISALKPQFGHLNTAAAAIEIVATSMMLSKQTVCPTLNLWNSDPECNLDFVPHVARKIKMRHALKLAFGLGWSNGAVALSAD